MNILAIESSMRQWSVALGTEQAVLVDFMAEKNQPISSGLLATVERLLSSAAWTAGQLDLIAVDRGPGSFTGLRVGITAAKVLAYSLGRPLMACDSLEIIAAATASETGWDSGPQIRVVMDAQRSEVFTALYRATKKQSLQRLEEIRIVPASSIIDNELIGDVWTGPALTRWQPRSESRLASENLWQPRAAQLAMCAANRFDEGAFADPFELRPEYYRPSYAEEK